jgi:hypothetical protein
MDELFDVALTVSQLRETMNQEIHNGSEVL